MGTIKGKNGRDLVDAEEIKKRWKEYTKRLYKKDLNEPDGVVSHPEPDILEYEVKWALRGTAVNKASGCNEIPEEIFKSLKDDAIKALHSFYVSKSGRPSSGHRTGKGHLYQFPRRVVLKNVLVIG